VVIAVEEAPPFPAQFLNQYRYYLVLREFDVTVSIGCRTCRVYTCSL
jgi:hypothetical protein